MLSIRTKQKETGSMELAGSLTRQANGEFPFDQNNTHIKVPMRSFVAGDGVFILFSRTWVA